MKLKNIVTAPDLRADTIAILLAGWSAHEPNPVQHEGFGGGFFDVAQPDGPATLWREHEAFLRSMAKAWRWTPTIKGPDGQLRFYGEHRAAGFSDHEADDPGDGDDEAA